jgi:hypothetical protein
MSNPIEEHINYYQHFAPNPTAFRESLEGALVYAKSSNKHLNMDLRDYFASKAMQGMATWDIKTMHKLATDFGEEPLDYLARNAFAIADAMMKERAKNA